MSKLYYDYYDIHDSDIERDILDRISLNSNINMINGVDIYWDNNKQIHVS